MAIDRDIEPMTAVELVIREKPHQGVFLSSADFTPGAHRYAKQADAIRCAKFELEA